MSNISSPGDRPEDGVVVGMITRTHGVRGEVYVRDDSDNPERFEPPARFRTDHAKYSLLVLRSCRPGPHGLIVEFAGVTSIELASELCGLELKIPRHDRRELDEGEFWPDQLVGLEVRQGTETIGVVEDVLLGPQNRLSIRRLEGGVAEIPFVEQLVPEVNPTEGWIRIEPPDGLFSQH